MSVFTCSCEAKGQPVPPQVTAERNHWLINADMLVERKNKHEELHEHHIRRVQEGTPLDALPDLQLPQPPPHPLPAVRRSISQQGCSTLRCYAVLSFRGE